MKTNVVKFENEPSVIRHSNVVLSEGLMPYRIVLCKLDGKYATYNERMVIAAADRGDNITELTCSHLGFDHGHYFDFKPEGHTGFSNWPDEATAKENAVTDFNQRCARVSVR